MKKDEKTISGNIVDVLHSRVYQGTLTISNGRIVDIREKDDKCDTYIIPGLVDAHIHIESSMLTPSEFARAAVIHGTVATVSDPHEIANVLGIKGVKYMIEDALRIPFKFYFGAPSCVPATPFETSGAVLGSDEIEELLKLKQIKYLGEVMNFPGVVNDDPEVINKINIAKKYSKLIDGHAPMLTGKELKKYVDAGISTDHECSTIEEALERLELGMNIQIREGSLGRNFEELISIVETHHDRCMFCSDDKHPDDLLKGHINELVKRGLGHGIDLMKLLRVACVNPVLHYQLDVGLLQVGDAADFIEVDNLDDFNVLKTYINGKLVAENGRTLIPKKSSKIVNNFNVKEKVERAFVVPYKNGKINVIEVIDGQLITSKIVTQPLVVDGCVVSDVKRDVLKMASINRYNEAKVATAFVKNFGLKQGAIASSVSHDSHNIVVIGVNDTDMCRAVNLIIENKGGISAASENTEMILHLPIAGIMSNEDYLTVAEKYTEMDKIAKSFGSRLRAPFMMLSFLSLLVIPKLKLSDEGLFDAEKFEFTDLFTTAS
ncbi:MAG: adenine deaminase [Candidatus Argoarchaeum ethanivorans]|uniref:Adenine deaminase n=1 Tax=Candidatus Argoarchaeum ethanivorans TaxID=2608793 RepID=A0A8B6SDI4_9EURY|nr:MAG: adenine deaminase [Candidatus Argoarchaeum ethanivorans]